MQVPPASQLSKVSVRCCLEKKVNELVVIFFLYIYLLSLHIIILPSILCGSLSFFSLFLLSFDIRTGVAKKQVNKNCPADLHNYPIPTRTYTHLQTPRFVLYMQGRPLIYYCSLFLTAIARTFGRINAQFAHSPFSTPWPIFTILQQFCTHCRTHFFRRSTVRRNIAWRTLSFQRPSVLPPHPTPGQYQ